MVILIWVINNIMDILTLEIKKWIIGHFPDCKVSSSLENLYVQAFKIFLPKWEASTASLKKLRENFQDLGNRGKSPKTQEMAAWELWILLWQRSKHWFPLLQSWLWDAPVVYFALQNVCWREESFSWMCPRALCVCSECWRGSSVFLPAVFGLCENKGKPAASSKAQKQMVKLKCKDSFWDKAVGLCWNLLHTLL